MTRYKPIILIIPAAFLVLALIIFLAISTQNRKISTPDLIQLAFERGEITAEYRLLYLAYALYEQQSLPARFHSNVGWRGTSTDLEIYKAISSSSVLCSMSPYVRSEFQRLFNPGTNCD
jgi:hypothetical protein